MVSFKIPLAVTAAALLQVASAGKCTTELWNGVTPGFNTGAFANYKLKVWKKEDPDNILDSQDSKNNGFNPYDGVQTLKSDALPAGDVRLSAKPTATAIE